MKTKKIGRPFITKLPKTVKITVMLDEEEHERLKKKAKEKGLTLYEYLRRKI